MSTAAEIWKRRVEGWRASGERCKAYAARIGVNHNTLAGWRWKLRSPATKAAKGLVAAHDGVAEAVGFVDVTEQLVTALAKEAGIIEPCELAASMWEPDAKLTIIDSSIDTDRVEERKVSDAVYLNTYKPFRHKGRCEAWDPTDPDPDPDPPTCTNDGVIASVQVDGGTLHVSGDVSAAAGLLRYSLVVDDDPEPLWSKDFDAEPKPTADRFDLGLSLAGVMPGTHTLGLWVKDVDMCTGDAAVDALQFEVEEDAPDCVPRVDTQCSGGDVY